MKQKRLSQFLLSPFLGFSQLQQKQLVVFAFFPPPTPRQFIGQDIIFCIQ